MKIILISGKAEAGKTITANIIKDALEKKGQPSCIVPYGQYVKDTAKMLFNWDWKKDEAGTISSPILGHGCCSQKES